LNGLVTVDGAMGEGGGQILRTALSLSLCLERPFLIRNIRSRRPKPGLRPQHLAAVNAAKALGNAEVRGAAPGSQELFFSPRRVEEGNYRFDIGTAGSAGLVMQTLLPALVTANGHFEIEITGGTHNPLAPPFEFLSLGFMPLLARMGARAELTLVRHGFYPHGGGLLELRVLPMRRLRPLHLAGPGDLLERYVLILLSRLPEQVARREARVIRDRLGLDEEQIRIERVADARGPGNAVMVVVRNEEVTEVFSSFGRRGIPAETVAETAAREVVSYLEAKVAVGVHLADQLLLPMALAGGGSFTTLEPSRHTLTNIEVIRLFMEIPIRCALLEGKRWKIEVG